MANRCKPVTIMRSETMVMFRCEEEPDTIYMRQTRRAPMSDGEEDARAATPRELRDEILGEIEETEARIGVGDVSAFQELGNLFALVEELAEIDPSSAMDRLEGVMVLADEIGSTDLAYNAELYMECLTHMMDPSYGLERAIELAQENDIELDPDNPLQGLADELYPEPVMDGFYGAKQVSQQAERMKIITEAELPVDALGRLGPSPSDHPMFKHDKMDEDE